MLLLLSWPLAEETDLNLTPLVTELSPLGATLAIPELPLLLHVASCTASFHAHCLFASYLPLILLVQPIRPALLLLVQTAKMPASSEFNP
jgi:hypothetical protein